MQVQEQPESNSQKAAFFRFFVLIVSLIIGVVLAFPDALTYSKFAALNGRIVEARYHVHWLRNWVAYGAPTGVYLFALNNMYRFCVLVLRDIYQVRFHNLPFYRYAGFALITTLSVISVIPFYGMAEQAGVPQFMVYANSFARFCMNDFAFFILMNFIFDYFVAKIWPRRLRKVILIDRLIFAVTNNKVHMPDSSVPIDHALVADMLKKNAHKPTRFSARKRKIAKIFSAVIFSCGIIAGLYLYTFAREAVKDIFGAHHEIWIAMLGVIPTSLLWGHDAHYSWIKPLRFFFRYGARRARPVKISYSKPIRRMFLLVIIAGIFLMGIPAALSEVMMVFQYTADNIAGWIIRVAAIPAFFGIYMTGLAEMAIRLCDLMQKRIFPAAVETRRQDCLASLRQLRMETLRDA